MAFDSLSKKKIFESISHLDDVNINKHTEKLFSSVFTSMGGRCTRTRIMCEIIEKRLNALQVAKKLNLDYKTISYNLKILEKNNFVTITGNGYGDLYSPAEIIILNLFTFYTVIKKIESDSGKPTKKYI